MFNISVGNRKSFVVFIKQEQIFKNKMEVKDRKKSFAQISNNARDMISRKFSQMTMLSPQDMLTQVFTANNNGNTYEACESIVNLEVFPSKLLLIIDHPRTNWWVDSRVF